MRPSSLMDTGMDEATANRWCDAWEREAAGRRLPKDGAYWEAGEASIRRGTCSATAWVVDVRIHSEDAGELHRHGRIWQRSNRTTADTILESDATTQEQTRRLARLTRWLIALTVVLVVLTFVLVGVTTALFWVTSHPT